MECQHDQEWPEPEKPDAIEESKDGDRQDKLAGPHDPETESRKDDGRQALGDEADGSHKIPNALTGAPLAKDGQPLGKSPVAGSKANPSLYEAPLDKDGERYVQIDSATGLPVPSTASPDNASGTLNVPAGEEA